MLSSMVFHSIQLIFIQFLLIFLLFLYCRTSLKLSEGRPPFSFYDGPPFATGLPHYGHLLAGTIKDIVTRYAHMNGFYVERRFGWDCHGLPVEYEIDKKLGIKDKYVWFFYCILLFILK